MSTPHPPTRDEQLLSAYLDGELNASEARMVEAWLEEDAEARALVEELRGVSRAVQALPREQLPPGWPKQLAARLDEAAQSSSHGASGDMAPRVPFGRSARGWWWSAAAIAAAVVIGMFFNEQEADDVADRPLAQHAPMGGEMSAREEAPAGRADNAPLGDAETRVAESSEADVADGAMVGRGMGGGGAAPLAEEGAELGAPAPAASSLAARPMEESVPAEAARAESALGLPLDARDRGGAPPGQYLIVWAEVPDQSLQRQEINSLLVSNGIEVEPRSESWDDVAEPVRRQIAIRNLEQTRSKPQSEGMRGGGFGGRFSVPDEPPAPAADASRDPSSGVAGAPAPARALPESADESTVDRKSDEDASAPPVEGETILVEATAEQIAALLAAMKRDMGNFRTVTVEPVAQLEGLSEHREQLARQSSQQGQQAAQHAPAVGVAEDFVKRLPSESQSQSQPAAQQEQQSAAEAVQRRPLSSLAGARGWARRLQRPEAWYQYNTAPPPEGPNYRLRDEAQAKARPSDGESPEISEQQQLARLNSFYQFAPNGREPGDPVLNAAAANQRLQVLLVLRNTDLPAPAAPASESP